MKKNDRTPRDSRGLHEDLREALESLEQYRLTAELEEQKRLLAQQKNNTLQKEISALKEELKKLKHNLHRVNKKYAKLKESPAPAQDEVEQLKKIIDKERQIYMSDREVLRAEIKKLEERSNEESLLWEKENISGVVESLRRELQLELRKGERQAKLILFMDEQLTMCQRDSLQLMETIRLLERKFSEESRYRGENEKEGRAGQLRSRSSLKQGKDGEREQMEDWRSSRKGVY